MVEHTSISGERRGLVARLLRESYAELLASNSLWKSEIDNWETYDRDVFNCPETVGFSLFLTRLDGCIAGFASWDLRQRPEYGVIGHNCILPEFRGQGLGKLQIVEVLRRLQTLGIRTAKVSTNDHPFFVPAQRMYTACGFREMRRIPWAGNPSAMIIEYEMALHAPSTADEG
ncbi:MAG: GNAT family N-acetyltransferase [FCB group bacterium]|jgi:GNAT superfamily N-acetyltransferase|nr:GNAT family N-acetyltransferase [FCB group bacterium]